MIMRILNQTQNREKSSRDEARPGCLYVVRLAQQTPHNQYAQARLSKRLRGEASPAASGWSSDHEEQSRWSRGIEDLLSEGSLASRLR
jgi:hypothetical protein